MDMNFFPLYENFSASTEATVDLVVNKNRLYKKYYYSMKLPNQNHVDLLIDHLTIDEDCVMKYCTKDYTVFESTKTSNLTYYVWSKDLIVEKIFFEELETVNFSNYKKKLDINYLQDF